MATTIPVVAGSGVLRIPVEELASHLATLEQDLSGGKSIELVRGETVVAEVRAKEVPVAHETEPVRHLPDFMGRMKAIYGDKMLPEGTGVRLIREDRDGRG